MYLNLLVLGKDHFTKRAQGISANWNRGKTEIIQKQAAAEIGISPIENSIIIFYFSQVYISFQTQLGIFLFFSSKFAPNNIDR